jgi:FkbH-like protein
MKSLVSMLQLRAAEEPDKEIYLYLRDGEEPGGSLTFGQLHSRARSISRWLRVNRHTDKPVLLAFPSGLEFIAAFFGCLYASAIAVPIDATMSRREDRRLQFIAEDSSARVLLTPPSRVPRTLPAGVTAVPIDQIPDDPDGDEVVNPAARALAYIQYTSGSTREAHGVMVTHANVLANLEHIDRGFMHDRESISVTWLPHFHDMGLVYGLLQPLYNSFRCVIMSPSSFIQRPSRWLRAISTYHATHSGGPNFAFDLCSSSISPETLGSVRLDSWRIAFNGAEPVQAETLRRFASQFSSVGFRPESFYPAYGLAESTLKVSGPQSGRSFHMRRFDPAALSRNQVVEVTESTEAGKWLVGCGAPDCGMNVAIVDPETLTSRTSSGTGEVWVSGPAVTSGYWRKPEETAKIFHASINPSGEGPYLRTGDQGFFYKGDLFIAGRIKDIVIIRGLNYYPHDIEVAATADHSLLRQDRAAAFSVDSNGTEALIVALETPQLSETQWEIIAATVRHSVLSELGLNVHRVIFLEKGSIPKTSSGKIRRSYCRELFLADRLKVRAVSEVPAKRPLDAGKAVDRSALLEADPTHRVELISQYLVSLLAPRGTGSDSIDVNQSAVAHGIDSLAAAAISSRLEIEFGVRLSPGDLLGDSSLEAVANSISQQIDGLPELQSSGPVASGENGIQRCSFEQERLWWLDQLVPGYTAHHLIIAIRLSGLLDESLFRNSLLETAFRHDPLHTRFVEVSGVPWQATDVSDPLEWSVENRKEELHSSISAVGLTVLRESRKPFALNRGPLFRVTMLHFSETSRVMVLALHHSVADGYSIGLLMHESVVRYHAALAGSPPDLPSLPYRYSDYVGWWRKQVDQGAVQNSYEYWVRTLEGIHQTELKLPYDRPRPQGAPLATSQYVFHIDAQLRERLRYTSAKTGATLFMTLAACFIALLHRCTGQEDIVVGIPSSGRPRQELSQLIGQFAYPLLLRTRVRSGMSLRQLIGDVRSRALEAYEYGNIPFSQIIEASGRQGSSGFNSLFQTMIGLIGDPISSIESATFSLELEDVPTANSDTDIFLTLIESAIGLRGLLVYNEQVFDAETVREFADSFHLFLRHATLHPDAALSELAISSVLERGMHSRLGKRTLAIAATFTSEPLADCLRFWSHRLGNEAEVEFSQYSQVFQQLLDPRSLFATNACGTNIVLIRLEDWLRREPKHERSSDCTDIAQEFVETLRSAASRFRVPVLVCLLSSEADFSQETRVIRDGIAQFDNVHLLTRADIREYYPVDQEYDRHADEIAHIPWTPDYSIAIATTIVRRLTALERRPVKAIALDCDNTLWTGICGEVGSEAVSIEEPRKFLQRFLLHKRDEGVLLCLCSKNNSADVAQVFERADMILRPEHFAAERVNWHRKSENLRDLAQDLGIAIDSIVLLDDDARECAEVRANCPEVFVAELPADSARIPHFLQHLWMLDPGAPATQEDKKRPEFYRQDVARKRERVQHSSLDDYLSALDISVRIEELESTNIQRVSQLVQRTNQFNLTGTRKSAREIGLEYAASTLSGIQVHLADRFGDYGLVGAVLYRIDLGALAVDTFVLSCRALGRRVEHRMLAWLGETAHKAGLREIELVYRSNGRNRPAAEFLETIASNLKVSGNAESKYRVPIQVAIAAPQTKPAGVSVAEDIPTPTTKLETFPRRPLHVPLAVHQPDTVQKIRQAMGMRNAVLSGESEGLQPRSDTERMVAAIWSEVLGVEDPPIDLNFFQAGGESLRASRVVARIRERFSIEFPLAYFFTEAPTIIEISREIERLELACLDDEDRAAVLAEVNASLEGHIANALMQDVTAVGDLSIPQDRI